MDLAGVIYAVKDGGCGSGYVGHTGHPLKKRMSEHYRDLTGHKVIGSTMLKSPYTSSLNPVTSTGKADSKLSRECTTHSSALKQQGYPALPLQSDITLSSPTRSMIKLAGWLMKI